MFHLYKNSHHVCRNPNRRIKLNLDYSGSAIGFFDGASTESSCGAGFLINCGADLTYKFRLMCGRGSNIKAKLLGPWGLLKVTICCGLGSFKILGDYGYCELGE